MAHIVKVNNLTQYLYDEIVLDNLRFNIAPGKLFILFGFSGAGKTTLISILAGIQAHNFGQVEVCDQRHIGLVTQQYSLFPNLTVQENLQVIGMMKGLAPAELNSRFQEITEAFHLEGTMRRQIERLPQGIKQRLALACAMLNNPKLLLVDDILSRGDPESNRIIVDNTLAYVAKNNTCIWTTSRLSEVLALASGDYVQIGFLDKGSLTLYQPEEFAEFIETHIKQRSNGTVI